jgi:flagella basal body P-ring formation protein FlgA
VNTRQLQFKTNAFPRTRVSQYWLCAVFGAGMLFSALSVADEVKVADVKPAAGLPASKQSLAVVKSKVAEFLTMQTIGYPGEVSVQVGAIDPNLKLAACDDLQLFLPNGSRAWGKTSVGVQCQAPSKWSIYVQSTVKVVGNYLVAAAPLAQGQVLSDYDVMVVKGDLTQLPAGVFTEQTQAIGRSVQISMTAGTVLRQEMLKVTPVVQQGQTVKLFTSGNGFSISAEGQALAKANEGQVTQVKVASGKVISGIARQGGQVEVAF